MNWQGLFTSFEGRINRAKFWIGWLSLCVLLIVANLVLWTIFGLQSLEGEISPTWPVAWFVWVIIVIAITYATFAVWAKRWHDRDRSGWWSLIFFVPIVGGMWFTFVPIVGAIWIAVVPVTCAIWILVELGCLPGTEGPNRFGQDPLAI
jgi:uncharacterized membrane protein YhaH (DUF805 family)